MIAEICEVIKNRNVIQFIYEDELRIVEPYCHGETRNLVNALRAYQIGGYSSTGVLGWKMFDLSKAQNIQSTGEQFTNIRNGYKRADKNMVRIFCQV